MVAACGAACSSSDPASSSRGSLDRTRAVSASTARGGSQETPGDPNPSEESPSGTWARTSEGYAIPRAPEVPSGPASAELEADLEALFQALDKNGVAPPEEILAVASHEDPRTSWIFTDILRFVRSGGAAANALTTGFERATGVRLPVESTSVWKTSIDFLIAWDLPALPNYDTYKERLFVSIEPGWAPFFADPESAIDWRTVTWGGVFIDDRPLGVRAGCPRGCIPALDDPVVTDGAGGDWYPDERIVFGITINGESRAYPKHQMETHEMVNDTLGGRRIAIPYCTLCGSAQAYFTDSVPDSVTTPVLRTSGLLSRSNKVMYDLVSKSVFDTFTGEALSGPLRRAGVRLEQATVVASTWGAWKAAHPDTTVLAEDGGLGRPYRLDPLGDRDDDGPIFPVGDVDPRLEAQELVVGVELGAGRTLAFPVDEAAAVLTSGGTVELAGISLEIDGSGLLARAADGTQVPTHAAFWFAWSQFWPETELWRAAAGGDPPRQEAPR